MIASPPPGRAAGSWPSRSGPLLHVMRLAGRRHEFGHARQCVGRRQGPDPALVQLRRGRPRRPCPPPSHGPKLTLIPGTPCSRSRQANPSRKALAALYAVWPPAPHTPAIEEVLRKKSSFRPESPEMASLKFQAPQTFPANTRSTSASSKACSGVVLISPAACTMPASGGRSARTVAKTRATSCGLATSAATVRMSQPHCSRIASMRCCAASLGARRLVSTRCRAPCAARYPAISSPIAPSPPVTRYVASSRSAGGVAAGCPARRVSRGT